MITKANVNLILWSYGITCVTVNYMSLWYISAFDSDRRVDVQSSKSTFVKELRSKMFRQHPGYYQVVFLKKTQMIIVSFYEYTVYIMFWIVMLYDCYYYCHFLSKYHCFLQCKIIFFSKSYKESGIKIITINWNIAISCIYEWMKCCQTRTIINVWFILLRDIILLRKSQLVTSYSLKLDVNRCF